MHMIGGVQIQRIDLIVIAVYFVLIRRHRPLVWPETPR